MIDPSKSFPSMKAEKVNPNLAFATVSKQAGSNNTPPAPKQVDPHSAAAQTLKGGHNASGQLQEHIAPAGDLHAQATALFPSMAAVHTVTIPEGYDHAGPVDQAQQLEFLQLARSFGLTQAQSQQLVALHCKSAFGPPRKSGNK
jgi:hypothetical protein